MTKVKIIKKELDWKRWFDVGTEEELWKEQADIWFLKKRTKKDLRKAKKKSKKQWSKNHKQDWPTINKFRNYPFVHACFSDYSKLKEIHVTINPFTKKMWDYEFVTEDGKKHGPQCTSFDTYQFRRYYEELGEELKDRGSS